MKLFLSGCAVTMISAALFAAEDKPAPSLSAILDQNIKIAESDVVPLAEAMPADKYDFAPSGAEFKKVRTFAQQMKHIAATNYMFASPVLGEKNPSEAGEGENGPASVKGKDAIVKYLKDSFAYAHKAAASITAANAMDMVPSPFGNDKIARMSLVSFVPWHTFDHYGQSVVYARMCGTVPPASR
jgi:uncharacterized damage-inducible protein DinB